MHNQTNFVDIIRDQFAEDVRKGLSSNPKYLPSRYFYDEYGSRLFQQIMDMPEYYLTDCEYEVLKNNKDEILRDFSTAGRAFNLIELGSGDGLKTKILLRHFVEKSSDFRYIPVDISDDSIKELTSELEEILPQLEVTGMPYEYFEALKLLKTRFINGHKNIILFLGSNIGNFTGPQAIEFLSELRSLMQTGDELMIGFDLMKDPEIIARAYNDENGITSAFNMNLLERMNRELGADFDLHKFRHYPNYCPVTGAARSYIVSLEDQQVYIEKLDKVFNFKRAEAIYTEISQKYSLETIRELAEETGFKIVNSYFDSKKYFTDSIWVAV